ncbi:MAG: hypothetical protein JKY65_24790 [Planctomycetes bacterium]|nr:hypothetical protein [Planctomycetota bacterium]
MQSLTSRLLLALGLLVLPFVAPTLAQSTVPTPVATAAAPAEEDLVEFDYGHNIRIEGTEAFVQAGVALLDDFAKLPTGEQVLRELGETGKTTVLGQTDDLNAWADVLDGTKLSDGVLDAEGNPSAGTDASVLWNPDFEIEGFSPPVIIGHELIHALHIHRGEANLDLQTEGDNTGTMFEELRTIGTDGYERETLTENALRREWNEAYPDEQIPAARDGHNATDFADEEDEATAAAMAGEDAPGSSDEGSSAEEETYKGARDMLQGALVDQK